MRKALKGRKPSPQCLKAVSEANTRRLKDPDVQAKMQVALAKKYKDPEWAAEYGKRISEGLNRYYETHDGPNLGRIDMPRGPDHPFWKDGLRRKSDRGPNWEKQANKARKRDGYICQECGMTNVKSIIKWKRKLNVHHIIPFSEFDSYKEANKLSNLITLCSSCHRKIECELLFNEYTGRKAQRE